MLSFVKLQTRKLEINEALKTAFGRNRVALLEGRETLARIFCNAQVHIQ